MFGANAGDLIVGDLVVIAPSIVPVGKNLGLILEKKKSMFSSRDSIFVIFVFSIARTLHLYDHEFAVT